MLSSNDDDGEGRGGCASCGVGPIQCEIEERRVHSQQLGSIGADRAPWVEVDATSSRV